MKYERLKTLMVCCIFLFCSVQAMADIRILSTTPASSVTAMDGEIMVEAFGTAGPFALNITGPNGFNENLSFLIGIHIFDGLAAGDYVIKVTNAYMCETILNAIVCTPLTINHPLEILPACGSNNGGFSFLNGGGLAGGVAPYTYLWDNGATTLSVNDLGAGTHTLNITDARGCNQTFEYELGATDIDITVNEPKLIPPSMCGSSDGQINFNTIIVEGGTAPYMFLWSNGAQIANISNLLAGTYTLTITDANGCEDEHSYTLENPSESNLAIELSHYEPFTDIINQGQLGITVTGGSGDYSYSWNNGQTTAQIYSLLQGTYSVTVTDDETGCQQFASFDVECEEDVTSSLWSLDIPAHLVQPCSDNSTGEMTAVINNSFAIIPFRYSWSGPSGSDVETVTSATINNLSISGDYCVTATDYCGNQETVCQTFICEEDCPYFFPQFEVDLCGEGTSYIRLTEVRGAIDDLAGEYSIVWPNRDEVSTYQVDNDGTITSSSGPVFNIIDVDNPTTHCFELINELGCRSRQFCYTFFPDGRYTVYYLGGVKFCGDRITYSLGGDVSGDYGGFAGPLRDMFGQHFSLTTMARCYNACYYTVDNTPIIGNTVPINNGSYFEYFPNDLEEPCKGGGKIKFNGCDFVIDEEAIQGTPSFIIVPPRPSSVQLTNDEGECGCVFQADILNTDLIFNNLADNFVWAWQSPVASASPFPDGGSGCLENISSPIDIYFQPIFAICNTNDDNGGGNSDLPCSETGCDEGMECGEDGNCYTICVNGECPDGEICEEGLCIPQCDPVCGEGYHCEDGECVVDGDFCGFREQFHGQGVNTYIFSHGDIKGSFVTFQYKTYNIPDKINLSGAIEYDIECISTGTEYVTIEYMVESDETSTVITVEPCASADLSKYRFRIDCAGMRGEVISDDFDIIENITVNNIKTEEATLNIQTIYPNPFNNQLNLNLSSPQAQALQVTLYDLLGQPVFRAQRKVQTGKNTLHLDLPMSLVDGIYFLEVRDEQGQTDGRKVVHAHRVKTTEDGRN